MRRGVCMGGRSKTERNFSKGSRTGWNNNFDAATLQAISKHLFKACNIKELLIHLRVIICPIPFCAIVKDTECSGTFPFSNRPAVSSPVTSQENKRRSFRARHLKLNRYLKAWCVPPPSLELVHSLGDPMLSRSSVFSSDKAVRPKPDL
ncbi:hypothetical protein F2Q70_00021031 [Brassica cretica]|uniref:Uncharacterized protein n=2 Tax=Brassica cretica TaxID=69181 RepID=A0A8S9GKE5_BRACR|nr:hypothetical protein F2Q70_00021031 [Brassica cretica]KAF2557516.1 hypothetical protein F2Q68_00014508 [Brassica cretica]KAF3608039.1 hypothetical protein DY000_02047012 [Brassica cretica]